jgi:hypothetical protein
VHALIRLGPHR